MITKPIDWAQAAESLRCGEPQVQRAMMYAAATTASPAYNADVAEMLAAAPPGQRRKKNERAPLVRCPRCWRGLDPLRQQTSAVQPNTKAVQPQHKPEDRCRSKVHRGYLPRPGIGHNLHQHETQITVTASQAAMVSTR